MSKQILFTSGADPEYFLRDETKSVVSAIDYIDGTKEAPRELPKGSMIQWDNVALEFATPIASNKTEFLRNMGNAFQDVFDYIPPGYDIVATPSVTMDEIHLLRPEAQEIGCEPDFDAWTGEVNLVDNTNADFAGGFRSAGAHFHFGHVKGGPYEWLLNYDGKTDIVKAMDYLAGIVMTLFDTSQAAIDRRKIYGRPGAFRPTPYGAEYRTLSNTWTKSPKLVATVYDLAQDALNLVDKGSLKEIIKRVPPEHMKDVIMRGDAKAAMKILNEHVSFFLSENSVTNICQLQRTISQQPSHIEQLNIAESWMLTLKNK